MNKVVILSKRHSCDFVNLLSYQSFSSQLEINHLINSQLKETRSHVDHLKPRWVG